MNLFESKKLAERAVRDASPYWWRDEEKWFALAHLEAIKLLEQAEECLDYSTVLAGDFAYNMREKIREALKETHGKNSENEEDSEEK